MSCVSDSVIDIEVIEHLIENTESTAVNVAGYENSVTAVKQAENCCDSSHTRTESETCDTAFKLSDKSFKGFTGRVACA